MANSIIPLSIGIYPQADAAHLLGMTPARLRRWVNGYTYWLRRGEQGHRRAKPPVIAKSDLPVLDNRVALSFLELMELRIVKALVDEKGLPLQRVRKAAVIARDTFGTTHPFASHRVFTERGRIYSSLGETGDSEVIELAQGRTMQVLLGELIPLLEEVDFDETTSLAHRWWPLTKAQPVVLDPQILFGAPVMAGTRVRTSIAAGMARRSGADEAALAFGVDRPHIEASLMFEQMLAAA